MAHFALDTALDRESDVPLGTQLAWRLRAAVAAGGLVAGDRLPPVRELAAAAGVNVNTVRAVYARLAGQGVIVSEHGRGTFVAPGGGASGDRGLAALAERAGRDARRLGVDPRELAAVLYARHDEPARPGEGLLPAGTERRTAVRAEIEALEHELARLDPAPAELRPEPPAGVPGARLVGIEELEAIRDGLATRVSALRTEARAARTRAASRASREPAPATPTHDGAGWPELLAGAVPPVLRPGI